jgi:hypothetical protein
MSRVGIAEFNRVRFENFCLDCFPGFLICSRAHGQSLGIFELDMLGFSRCLSFRIQGSKIKEKENR